MTTQDRPWRWYQRRNYRRLCLAWYPLAKSNYEPGSTMKVINLWRAAIDNNTFPGENISIVVNWKVADATIKDWDANEGLTSGVHDLRLLTLVTLQDTPWTKDGDSTWLDYSSTVSSLGFLDCFTKWVMNAGQLLKTISLILPWVPLVKGSPLHKRRCACAFTAIATMGLCWSLNYQCPFIRIVW